MDRLEGGESTEDRRSDEDIIWARLIRILKLRELWVYGPYSMEYMSQV